MVVVVCDVACKWVMARYVIALSPSLIMATRHVLFARALYQPIRTNKANWITGSQAASGHDCNYIILIVLLFVSCHLSDKCWCSDYGIKIYL